MQTKELFLLQDIKKGVRRVKLKGEPQCVKEGVSFAVIPGIFLLLVLCLLTSSSNRSHTAVMSMRASCRTFFMSAWERS